MLKKSFENIDNRASVPKGIEFRKELYWGKIEKIPSKKAHPYWIWIAASITLFVGYSFWLFLGSQEHSPQYIITQVPEDSQKNMAMKELPKPTTNDIFSRESTDLKFHEPLPLQETDTLVDIATSEQKPTNTQPHVMLPSFNIDEEEKEVQEEKQLSPSADALKKALANTKKEVPKEEKEIIEKLTFDQMIQARKNYFIEKSQYKKSKKNDE